MTALVGMATHISKRLLRDNSLFLRRETTSRQVPYSLTQINSFDKQASALYPTTRSISGTIQTQSSSMTTTQIIRASRSLNRFHNPLTVNQEGITCTTDKAIATIKHLISTSSVLKISILPNRVLTLTTKLNSTSNNI